jgi:large subunit ribosomal protein L18
MAKTIRRRRLENKTDYKARLELLKSGRARLIARKSNRFIIAQIVTSELAQDKVLATANSKELLAKGWPKEKSGSLKSLPAAYLTGMLLVKKLKSPVKEAILDSGMYRNVKKSRIYAVVKGAIDAGLKVPASQEALPSNEDLKRNEGLAPILEKLSKELKHG